MACAAGPRCNQELEFSNARKTVANNNVIVSYAKLYTITAIYYIYWSSGRSMLQNVRNRFYTDIIMLVTTILFH
jgi:putative heme iron utilization protein